MNLKYTHIVQAVSPCLALILLGLTLFLGLTWWSPSALLLSLTWWHFLALALATALATASLLATTLTTTLATAATTTFAGAWAVALILGASLQVFAVVNDEHVLALVGGLGHGQSGFSDTVR